MGVLRNRFMAGGLCAVALGVGAVPAAAHDHVVHVRVKSIVHPVSSEFIVEAIATADRENATAFVLELDTPGGLLTSTRDIFSAMLGAQTPVVVYVAPAGAQAASAGFFVLMAADVAAMAPGTNTGAAHPVGGQGETIEGVLGEKVEQDAAATIRSLAERNGRDVELAEQAVVESRSFSAEEALEAGLVDLVASDLDTLLAELDGRRVAREGAEPLTLATAGARVETLHMNAWQRLLAAIAHPNIAYILMTLGGLGLYFELSNSGSILPGVVGGICLILAFFALSVLPVNYAGLALIGLAALFFIAEIKVTSYGLLTVGGVVSLVLGSLMLFKSFDPAIRVGLDVIVTMAAIAAVVVVVMLRLAVSAHGRQVATGSEGLVNESGVARTELAPLGKVFVHGELWNAQANGTGEPIAAGERIVVVGVEGMLLKVRSQAPPSAVKEI